LQGWLLCAGFVCFANVPDLVRWAVFQPFKIFEVHRKLFTVYIISKFI
jgi:hypothetical protein